MSVRPPFSLAIDGDSTFTGRFSADWVPRLLRELPTYPEAKGPIVIYNMGKGSQTSTSWGVPTAPLISALKPRFIITSGYELNGCVDFGGGPAVSRAQNVTNLQDMVAEWRANIPGVDITFMTANSVSTAVAVNRPTLADYYADTVTLAATLEVGLIDNYAGWPKPLPQALTYPTVPFIVPPTPGYAGMGDAVTLNVADKSGHITLSGGNLTANTNAGGEWALARATAAIADKQHFDMKVTAVADASYPSVGLSTAGVATNTYLGQTANSIGLYRTGQVQYNNAIIGSAGFTYGVGDTVGVEYDDVTDTVYFMKGAVRTGFSVAGIGGAMFPTVGMFDLGTGCVMQFSDVRDGLHPIWTGAVDTYLYPNVLAWARAKMAALWPD